MSLHCVRLRETALPRSVAAGLLAAAWVSVAAGVPAAGASGPSAREQWHPTPLFGGHVIALAQAASAPKVFYAGTDVAGIFRSDDGGETWSARNQSLTGRELAIGGVEVAAGLAVAPSDPNLVYAMSESGLLRSRDGGNTWTLLGAAPALNRLSFRLSGSLLGAAGDGLYESGDEGDSWTLLAFEGQYVSSALEDSRGRHTFFATVEPVDGLRSRVWKSTDGGASWQIKFAAEDNFDQLTLDPSRPGTLYMLGNLDMYRSVDEGETWEPLLASQGFGPVAIAVSANGILYAAVYAFGVAHSLDGGETWLPMPGRYVPSPADEIWDLAVDAAHPDTDLAGGATGIWRSLDRGSAWSTENVGLMASAPTSLAIGSEGSLLAMNVSGLWRSDNGGSAWQPTGLVGPSGTIVADPVRPEILYAPDVLVRSSDGGRTWRTMNPPFVGIDYAGGTTVTSFAVDPRSPDILYLSGYTYFNAEVDPFFFRSNNGGTTWRSWRLDNGIYVFDAIAVAPSEPDVVYAIDDGVGFLRSDDRGRSWSLAGEGLPVSTEENYPDPPLSSLAVDPRLSSLVYVGNAAGIYRSTDGGRHFAAMGTGLEADDVATIVVDPTDPRRVYAGVVSLGVFRWNGETNRWDALNDGFPPNADPYGGQFNGTIALAAGSHILYAATARGVYRLRLRSTVLD
jgi:photosystem II stability/assembly factor-like uncharacterized protein